MYTLKGIFPEPKKEQKKDFIKENMKQLKFIQGKSPKEPRYALKDAHGSRRGIPMTAAHSLGQVKSSPSSKSGKLSQNVGKTNLTKSRKKQSEPMIKKGDMAEFLKRKELRQVIAPPNDSQEEESSDSSSRLRDVGCQTIESNLAKRLADSAKLTMLYQKKDDDGKMKACGDTGQRSPSSPTHHGPEELIDVERNRSRLNAILERRDSKDPYLPTGYQKGVLPKYLRERKEQATKDLEISKAEEDHALCPPGHVTLPDAERKETLRMLRNSFAELVSELNKMPVKTDTLRMRNRKMELEKQLAKLEEGIKVFSRPKVFVKIGE